MRDLRIGGIYRKLSLVPAGFIGADLGAIGYQVWDWSRSVKDWAQELLYPKWTATRYKEGWKEITGVDNVNSRYRVQKECLWSGLQNLHVAAPISKSRWKRSWVQQRSNQVWTSSRQQPGIKKAGRR